jgi:hypothetical protein
VNLRPRPTTAIARQSHRLARFASPKPLQRQVLLADHCSGGLFCLSARLRPAARREPRRQGACIRVAVSLHTKSFAHAAPPARQLCREQKSETAQCCLPA